MQREILNSAGQNYQQSAYVPISASVKLIIVFAYAIWILFPEIYRTIQISGQFVDSSSGAWYLLASLANAILVFLPLIMRSVNKVQTGFFNPLI